MNNELRPGQMKPFSGFDRSGEEIAQLVRHSVSPEPANLLMK